MGCSLDNQIWCVMRFHVQLNSALHVLAQKALDSSPTNSALMKGYSRDGCRLAFSFDVLDYFAIQEYESEPLILSGSQCRLRIDAKS